MNNQLHVLVIEDDRGYLFNAVDSIERDGHRTTALRGIIQLEPRFIGLGLNNEHVEIDLDTVDLVLCDFAFNPTKHFDGAAVANSVARNKRFYGMGSLDHDNDKMVANGAIAAFRKWFMLIALKDRDVTVTDLFGSPKKAKADMAAMIRRWNEHPTALEGRMLSL